MQAPTSQASASSSPAASEKISSHDEHSFNPPPSKTDESSSETVLCSRTQSDPYCNRSKKEDQVRWCVNQSTDPSNDPVWQQVLAQTCQRPPVHDALPVSRHSSFTKDERSIVQGNTIYSNQPFGHTTPSPSTQSTPNVGYSEGLISGAIFPPGMIGHGRQPIVPPYMMPGSTYVDNRRCLDFGEHVVQHPAISHNVPQQCFAPGGYQPGEYVGSTMNGFEVDGQMRMVRTASRKTVKNLCERNASNPVM